MQHQPWSQFIGSRVLKLSDLWHSFIELSCSTLQRSHTTNCKRVWNKTVFCESWKSGLKTEGMSLQNYRKQTYLVHALVIYKPTPTQMFCSGQRASGASHKVCWRNDQCWLTGTGRTSAHKGCPAVGRRCHCGKYYTRRMLRAGFLQSRQI